MKKEEAAQLISPIVILLLGRGRALSHIHTMLNGMKSEGREEGRKESYPDI